MVGRFYINRRLPWNEIRKFSVVLVEKFSIRYREVEIYCYATKKRYSVPQLEFTRVFYEMDPQPVLAKP